MRQLKFRVWEQESRRMYTAETLHLSTGKTMLKHDTWDWYKRDRVIMQYTGMKDKSEKPQEIYEGDIILCPITNKYFTVEYDENGGSYMFCEVGKDVGEGYYEFETISSFWMVCGNIYEHPHLLEQSA